MKTTEYKIEKAEITEWTDDYSVIEGLTYWEDKNHFGSIYITQEMYDKYDLDRCPSCETVIEAYGDDYLEFSPGPQFTHVLYIDHCAGVTPIGVPYSDGEWIDGKYCNHVLHATQETPHGDCYEEEFVAWWCEFPVELFTESEENLQIGGWADG